MATFWTDGILLFRNVRGTWPPRTARASITASIRKWQTLVAYLESHRDAEDDIPYDGAESTCALCAKYVYTHDEKHGSCAECPILHHTGREGCKGTPYISYFNARSANNHKAALRAARAEVKFLTGLLDQ